MRRMFTKSDLETGDIIETRNGERGVVILDKNCIVYQAGGFDELDVFTDEEHRGKGLADHCVYEMIRQSHAKGLTIHWDAQNPMSSKMAIGHGFVPEAEYAVYWVEK